MFTIIECGITDPVRKSAAQWASVVNLFPLGYWFILFEKLVHIAVTETKNKGCLSFAEQYIR